MKTTTDALVAALEAAQNGLRWYQDMYPLAGSGADDEMHEQIDAALALARAEQESRPEFSISEYKLPRESAFATRRYGVRVTHKSGLMAECGTERSAHANKEKAWQELAAKLAREEQAEPVAYIHRHGNHWEVSERGLTDDEKARGWTEEPL